MAKARLIKAKPVPPPPDWVELQLTADQAAILRLLLGRCNGGFLSEVYWALNGVELPDKWSYRYDAPSVDLYRNIEKS